MIVLSLCLALSFQRAAVLERFVDKDLTWMSESNQRELRYALGHLSEPKHPLMGMQEPKWIKKYEAGPVAWIYAAVDPGDFIPSTSTVRIYALDGQWQEVNCFEFSTGHRLQTTQIALVNDPWFPAPLLKIHVESQGPYTIENGRWKPTSHPASGINEWYAFDEKRAYLVKLEDGNAHPFPNFCIPSFTIGPDPVGRTVKDWTEDLNAADPNRVLAALVWLGSQHRNSAEARKINPDDESRRQWRVYNALRTDTKIRNRLNELTSSLNPWISIQAKSSQRSISEQRTNAPPKRSPGRTSSFTSATHDRRDNRIKISE